MPSNDSKKNVRGKYYLSAGKTVRQGFELGVNAEFKNDVSIRFAGSLISSKYDEYKDESILTGKAIDYKDNKIAGVPDFFYTAGLRYSPSYFLGAYVELGAQGVSEYYVDDANQYKAPSYTIFNLSLGAFKAIETIKGVSIKPFVSINNLLDKKYVGSVFINPDKDEKGNAIYIEPGLPRNINFGLSVMFN